MTGLRGVKLAIPVSAFVGLLAEIVESDGEDAPFSDETLGRLADNFNAKGPQEIKVDGGGCVRITRMYVKDGALYGDLDGVPPALMEQLRVLHKTGASLAVTLHLGDEEVKE